VDSSKRAICREIRIVFYALTALFCPVVYGQLSSGEIHLEVKDPSGAAMQATGWLHNVANGIFRSFQTDVQGSYIFTTVPYGRYRLEVAGAGFATQSLLLDVDSAMPIARQVTMALGKSSDRVDVVAATPLPGSEVSLLEIPTPVQTASQQDIRNSGSLDLADLLNRRLNGVNMNENQGNPFQPDVNYRGYTASPLLGTPQGVSIYMDGVRLNQPFGDVVAWDLIPRIAISEVALIPGSNPLFGLNTLGGAVSIGTKDGRSHPGTSVAVSGGSFGRRAVEFEYGAGNARGLSWYVAGNLLHDDGWRVASPSDVRQMFSKVGWQDARTFVSLSFAFADNSLTGNGVQEQRFLARDYSSAYTLGDVTGNRSPFFNLSVRHAIGNTLTFAANSYYRYIRADTINPNLNTSSLDESVYQPTAAEQGALKAAGYSGYPTGGAKAANTPFPYWRCIAASLLLTNPLEKCNGIIVDGFTKQNNYGLSGQTTWTAAPGDHRNQLTAGAAWDRSSLSFQQSTQFAYINPDYTLTPVRAFGDGSTSQNGTPVDTRVNLHGLPQTWSLFATDTLWLGNRLSFTVSGRYNRTTIYNRDRITSGGRPGSLDGHYVFERFNSAAGVTFSPVHYLNAYASYSEGSRAPTSIELGCADPENPCNLPNALAGDPPLKQVVTRTVEAGVRSGAKSWVNWSAGWFWAQNHDDLLFVSSPQTGKGYFKNFGATRRTGAEVHLGRSIRRVTMEGNYTFVNATYQSPESIRGSSNSTNDSALAESPGLDGVIQIQPGDRIPLIPQHMAKASADFQATRNLSFDLGFVAVSTSYARGNENNLSKPDSVYYLGPGTSPGYGVVNLGGRYLLHRRIELFVQIDNLLDHRYYTAAQLSATGFTAQGTFIARPFAPVDGNYPIVHATFYAPGAPIGVWGGMRFRL
jgi:outer membrane receptor protein involved in Fe transport